MHNTFAKLGEHPTVKALHTRPALPAVFEPLDAAWLRACAEQLAKTVKL